MAILSLSWSQEGDFSFYDCQLRLVRMPARLHQSGGDSSGRGERIRLEFVVLTMQRVFLEEHSIKENLYPFAQASPVSNLRVGILTIKEKWEKGMGEGTVVKENEKDTRKFPVNLIPGQSFFEQLSNAIPDKEFSRTINYPWDLIYLNDWAIREDFKILTTKRNSDPIPENVEVINSRDIFIEEGASINHCFLNASTGPIYIGKNTEIMEGAFIRGPFALGEGAVVKMGAKIYGATTIGPYSVAGGEIKNSILMGYSNKAHDGYLGDSVIGEWCNIGAGTSNSNLKNNAGQVKVWHKRTRSFIEVGLKCGLIMGDYSRSAINTSFNTGTVIGICANVFGPGLTPKYIADFSWGFEGKQKYTWEKVQEHINNWKKLKNSAISETEIQNLKSIFDRS